MQSPTHMLPGESTTICQERKVGSALTFSAEKSLFHMSLAASYQNSPGMICESRKEVNVSVSSLGRERLFNQLARNWRQSSADCWLWQIICAVMKKQMAPVPNFMLLHQSKSQTVTADSSLLFSREM